VLGNPIFDPALDATQLIPVWLEKRYCGRYAII
jgi:hypothetical protein